MITRPTGLELRAAHELVRPLTAAMKIPQCSQGRAIVATVAALALRDAVEQLESGHLLDADDVLELAQRHEDAAATLKAAGAA